METICTRLKIRFRSTPGGVGTRAAMVDDQILSWVQKNVEASELTLSICSGARIVGALGLLENRPFCTHHQVYEHMKEISPSALPHPEKRFIQSSDKLFTAGGITAGIDLSFHVVEK